MYFNLMLTEGIVLHRSVYLSWDIDGCWFPIFTVFLLAAELIM
jgi:hypothetical protein